MVPPCVVSLVRSQFTPFRYWRDDAEVVLWSQARLSPVLVSGVRLASFGMGAGRAVVRLYYLSCEKCGWKAPEPVDSRVAAHFQGHRCRGCLKLDPKSTQLFTVKEVILPGAEFILPTD